MTYSWHNRILGAALEDPTHSICIEFSYDVKPHEVTDKGLDVEASKNEKLMIAGECWNWPHVVEPDPDRWNRTMSNLEQSSAPYKILPCVHVHPTKEQYKDAHNKNVCVLQGDTLARVKVKLRKYLSKLSKLSTHVNAIDRAEPFSSEEPASFDCLYYSSFLDLEYMSEAELKTSLFL